MPLPSSFARDGFSPGDKARQNKFKLPNGKFLKHLMIGTEGETDTGKTEFILSCPGPGLVVCVDRMYEAMLDNPHPPPSRRSDFAFKIIDVPLNMSAQQSEYVEYYKSTRDTFYKALANPDAITVAMDGDSHFWELQKLAHWGKVTGIWPQTKYGDVYAERRVITARAFDSGKIVIGTNTLTDVFETVLAANGEPILEKDGSVRKVKTGDKRRQGYPDQNYLWQIQLRHLYQPPSINKVTKKEVPGQWGIRILKCKANTSLVGYELWGSDATFTGLVQVCYPDVPLSEWGLT